MESVNVTDPGVKAGSGEVPVANVSGKVPDDYKLKIEPAVGGRYMKLPDWEGFWFIVSGRVYVYTKDGQFLDSPYFDRYAEMVGWEYIPLTQDQSIKFVKDLRINIDTVYKIADQYLSQGRELSTFKSEMQWAFMWLGYVLGELGDVSPYKTSFDPKSPVIEPHADLGTEPIKDYFHTVMIGFPDETARVKYLRAQVSVYINALSWLFQGVVFLDLPYTERQLLPYVNSGGVAVVHLSQANMMLGQQLNQIRLAAEKNTAAEFMKKVNEAPNKVVTSIAADQEPLKFYDPLTPTIEKVGAENVTIFDGFRNKEDKAQLQFGEAVSFAVCDVLEPKADSLIYDVVIVDPDKIDTINDLVRGIKTGAIQTGAINETVIVFLLVYTESQNGVFSVRLKFKAMEKLKPADSFTIAIKI
jgi:hypothetical protein